MKFAFVTACLYGLSVTNDCFSVGEGIYRVSRYCKENENLRAQYVNLKMLDTLNKYTDK